MSLLPTYPRPQTLFEAISDLATSQYENHQLLDQLVTSHTANAASHDALMASLVRVQGTLATTMAAVTAVHQQIADAATYWQKNVAAKPAAVKVEGPVRTEVEQVVVLSETRRLSPGPLLAILGLLHRIELRLADIGIAENRPAREKAVVAYQAAIREFEEHIAAHRHLKGLKPQLKGLVLKLPGDAKEAIDAELLEKFPILHALSAGTVALEAANTPQHG
jgi:hypothetical protein